MMKAVGLICVVVLLMTVLAACGASQMAPAQPSSSSAVAGSRPEQQSEWDRLVREAAKEGKVVIYGSVIGNTRQEWTQIMKEKYGISLEFLQGRGSEIAEKMISERRAGLNLYDVAIGGLTTYWAVIKPGKVVASIEPLIVLDEVKTPANWRTKRIPFLDKEKTIMPLASMASYYVAVNATMVKDGEITSYDDLLDPKWKGKVVLNDPSLSGAGNEWFNFMMLQAYGKEKGAEFMRKLARNDLVITRDERLHVEWIAKGKYPIAVGAKRTILNDFVDAGAPIKSLKLKGQAALSSGSLNFYVSDKPSHPNAQKLFVNWVLSKEAADILVRNSGYASERADATQEGLDPVLVPGPNDTLLGEEFDLEKTANMKVAREIFKDLIK